MEPARSLQSNSQSNPTLEGFEEFYQAPPVTAREVPGDSPGTAANSREQPGYAKGIECWLTVEEAAKRFGISANAVIKRLGKGKLRGRKVAGQFGERWLVDPTAVPQEVHVELSDENWIGTAREVPGDSPGTAPRSQEQSGYAEGIAQKSLDVLGEVIRQQTEQIRLQNEVIKHISEQLKDKDSQLKLLTDSQHKHGWWVRFSSWFLGGRT